MSSLSSRSSHTTRLIELITLHSGSNGLTSELATWCKLASIVKNGFKGTDAGLLGKLLAGGLFDLLFEVLGDHSIPRDQIESYEALVQPARSVRVDYPFCNSQI